MTSMDTPGLLEAIAAKLIQPRPDCLIWPGAVDRGYGRIFVDGTAKRVHRVAWELTNGPIPDGLTIDHLCRIRSCVNVAHMELVTQSENSIRANPFRQSPAIPLGVEQKRPGRRRPGSPKPPATECRNGHAYTPENTRKAADGTRARASRTKTGVGGQASTSSRPPRNTKPRSPGRALSGADEKESTR